MVRLEVMTMNNYNVEYIKDNGEIIVSTPSGLKLVTNSIFNEDVAQSFRGLDSKDLEEAKFITNLK